MSRLDRDIMTLPDGSKVPRPKRTVQVSSPKVTPDTSLRAAITELVTDMTVDRSISEEYLIDRLIDLNEELLATERKKILSDNPELIMQATINVALKAERTAIKAALLQEAGYLRKNGKFVKIKSKFRFAIQMIPVTEVTKVIDRRE